MTDVDVADEAPEGFDGDAGRTAVTDELEDLVNELEPDADYSPDEAAAEALHRHQEFLDELERQHQASATPPQAVATSVTTGAVTTTAPAEAGRAHTADRVRATDTDGVAVTIGGAPVVLRVDSEVVIGRRGDHRVTHPRVSRRHLQVRVAPDGVHCRDLGSANGTWLLRAGDRTPLGDHEIVLVPGDVVVTVDDVELLRWPDRS